MAVQSETNQTCWNDCVHNIDHIVLICISSYVISSHTIDLFIQLFHLKMCVCIGNILYETDISQWIFAAILHIYTYLLQ